MFQRRVQRRVKALFGLVFSEEANLAFETRGQGIVFVLQLDPYAEGAACRVHDVVHDLYPADVFALDGVLGYHGDAVACFHGTQHARRRNDFHIQRGELGKLHDRLLFHALSGLQQALYHDAVDRALDGPPFIHFLGLFEVALAIFRLVSDSSRSRVAINALA